MPGPNINSYNTFYCNLVQNFDKWVFVSITLLWQLRALPCSYVAPIRKQWLHRTEAGRETELPPTIKRLSWEMRTSWSPLPWRSADLAEILSPVLKLWRAVWLHSNTGLKRQRNAHCKSVRQACIQDQIIIVLLHSFPILALLLLLMSLSPNSSHL